MIKRQARVLGIDDAPFSIHSPEEVLVVATMFRGGDYIDGVLSCHVTPDGTDSTEKLAAMINRSRFKGTLQAVFTDGIALAGFNIIDIKLLNRKTGLPVIVTMRGYPDIPSIESALARIGQEEKTRLLRDAGEIRSHAKIHFQCAGIAPEEAAEMIDVATTNSDIPECLRVAHLIAGGVVRGESRGKA